MSIAFDTVLCVDTSFIINARKRKTEVQHQPWTLKAPAQRGSMFPLAKKKKREEMYFIMHLQKKS
jgi:hypothetical protein